MLVIDMRSCRRPGRPAPRRRGRPQRSAGFGQHHECREPTSVAVAATRKLVPGVSPYTDCGMNGTITDHSDQTENPTCSAATDHTRFRRGMACPPASQAVRSSGARRERMRRRTLPLMQDRAVQRRCARVPIWWGEFGLSIQIGDYRCVITLRRTGRSLPRAGRRMPTGHRTRRGRRRRRAGDSGSRMMPRVRSQRRRR
jgi:hypothetical protein